MDPIDQSEPVDHHVQPIDEVVTGDSDDYGGPEVASMEEALGEQTASDDYENSHHESVDHLDTSSTYDPRDYTDFYTS